VSHPIHNIVKMNMTSKLYFSRSFDVIFFCFFHRLSNPGFTLVMLVIHNLDHMMQPQEWETLLTREIHGARVSYLSNSIRKILL
jgi:hypothetical protein